LKAIGPLLGYNNNIPYRARVYHVQTEDSGSKRPHVITHLFADGGRIVHTRKTSYADFVGHDGLADKVRALMREQHKAMVIALRDGNLDHLIEEVIAPPEPGKKPSAPSIETRDAPPIELLERAAEVDDREFYRQMEQVVTAPIAEVIAEVKAQPADPGAGTYSFVGAKRSAPAASSQKPADDRMRSAKPDGSDPPESDSPPATDLAASVPVRRLRKSGPPPPPDSDDRPTTMFARVPHAREAKGFGSRFASGRRFDEVVSEFLRRGARR
jgi:hypothetical protein